MFEDLLRCVNEKRLPFFWDREYNMLGKFNDEQLNALSGNLNSIYRTLKKAQANKDWEVLQSLFCKYMSNNGVLKLFFCLFQSA